MTLTVDVINNNALNLLRDLASLNYIRLNMPETENGDKSAMPEIPPRRYNSLEEVEAALALQNSEAVQKALKTAHGVLKNSKAWGKGVDVVGEIRKMRDGWVNPWEQQGV
jgi:hypothetical protein